MTIEIIIHEAEEGGFWGEVPVPPGCVSQGDSLDELVADLQEAIAGWVEPEAPDASALITNA